MECAQPVQERPRGSTLRVAMSSRKGGAGKTVVTVLLARELVRQGKRVLVLDLDPQSVGSSMRLGADISSPLPYTAVDLVRGALGREFQPQGIVPGRLDVIAGNQRDLGALEMHLADLTRRARVAGARPRILDARLAAIELGYDFVLIDTPTGFGEITTNALEAAYVVLSPIDMRSADNVESVRDLQEHLAELPHRPEVYFVPNKAARHESQWTEALRRATALCAGRLLLCAALPESTTVPQAMSAQRDVAPISSTGILVIEAVWWLGQFIIEQSEQRSAAAATIGGTT